MKKEIKETNTNNTSNGPWMITLPKASKMSGIPVGHLRKMIKAGDLKYFRAGDRYYIWVEDLREALRSYGAK